MSTCSYLLTRLHHQQPRCITLSQHDARVQSARKRSQRPCMHDSDSQGHVARSLQYQSAAGHGQGCAVSGGVSHVPFTNHL